MTLDLTVNRKAVKEDEGTLYLLYIDLDEADICKVGLTHRDSRPQDRWLEILESIWKHYRVFPRMYPKRFRKVDNVYDKEQRLLEYLKEYKYEPVKKVQGHTEMLRLDRDIIVAVYEKIVSGEQLCEHGEVCSFCGNIKKFEFDGDMVCGFRCGK